MASDQSLTFFIQYIDALSSEFLRGQTSVLYQTLLVILHIAISSTYNLLQ